MRSRFGATILKNRVPLLLLTVLGFWSVGALSPTQAQACTPAVLAPVTVSGTDGDEVVAISVTVQAAAAGIGDKLTRVSFASVTNGVVEVQGASTTVPSSVTINPPLSSWTFVLRKLERGRPFMVRYIVTDLCGDVPKFAGHGLGSPQVAPPTATATATAPLPTPTVVPPTATPVAPSPTGAQPTILDQYVLNGPWHYDFAAYRPRQFTTGLDLDAGAGRALLNNPGPYAGWDALLTPNEPEDQVFGSSDWVTLRLNRQATLAIVWRGGPVVPSWLASWSRGDDVVIDGQTVPTYKKVVAAGESTLGGVYQPGEPFSTYRNTFTVLFAEANGTPPAPPPVPAGREVPRPNETCPTWVHDQYVTTGPDGRLYPTWHRQIDPIYWCYFRHEHGSDPELFNPGYKPAYGYVTAAAGASEGHAGFKSYVFDSGTGYRWLISHHFGTASIDRACARFHALDIAVANPGTGEIGADLHLMGDYGMSVVNATGQEMTPAACPMQATQAQADGSNGLRKLPVQSAGTIFYEPWRVDSHDNILGFHPMDLTINSRNPVAICNTPACDQAIITGETGSFRFVSRENAGPSVVAEAQTGSFYTDPRGRAIRQAGQAGAIRQYVKPGFSATGGTGPMCFTLDPWRARYVCSSPLLEVDLNLEGALRSPN